MYSYHQKVKGFLDKLAPKFSLYYLQIIHLEGDSINRNNLCQLYIQSRSLDIVIYINFGIPRFHSNMYFNSLR